MTAVNKKSVSSQWNNPSLKICKTFLIILPKYFHKGKGKTVPLHVMMAYWEGGRRGGTEVKIFLLLILGLLIKLCNDPKWVVTTVSEKFLYWWGGGDFLTLLVLTI